MLCGDAAVLKCAKAKPREAATFLGYATAVVGIAPSGIDLAKITGQHGAVCSTVKKHALLLETCPAACDGKLQAVHCC